MRNENSLEVRYMMRSKSFITQPRKDGTVSKRKNISVFTLSICVKHI